MQSICQQDLDFSQHTVRYVIKHSGQASGELREALQCVSAVQITLLEEEDSNLYNGLAQAFQSQTTPWADLYSWLGAGDCLSPNALDIVARVAAQGPQWITGIICGYNQEGHLVESKLPFCYRQSFLRKPVYGPLLPFVQAESTFWAEGLHKLINWDQLGHYRLAGDSYLWHLFSQHCALTIVEAWLGGFERRPGQLSHRFRNDYLREQRSISDPLVLADHPRLWFDKLMWHAPRSWQRRFGGERFIYDETAGEYVRWPTAELRKP